MVRCPYCETSLTTVAAEDISIGGNWNGVGYACPYCSKLLSVSVDPFSIQADIVSEISAHVDEVIRSAVSEILDQLRRMG